MKPILVIFEHVLGLSIKTVDYFKGACHHFLVSATEVTEVVQLVFNMELHAISSMCQVGSEHKVCFEAFLSLYRYTWVIQVYSRCTQT